MDLGNLFGRELLKGDGEGVGTRLYKRNSVSWIVMCANQARVGAGISPVQHWVME